MLVTVVITKDRTDRNPAPKYRFALWDAKGDVYGQSRASGTASAAKRDAERLFGPLEWTTDVATLDIIAPWVLQAALVECRAASK